jgi:hypothetical protein
VRQHLGGRRADISLPGDLHQTGEHKALAQMSGGTQIQRVSEGSGGYRQFGNHQIGVLVDESGIRERWLIVEHGA